MDTWRTLKMIHMPLKRFPGPADQWNPLSCFRRLAPNSHVSKVVSSPDRSTWYRWVVAKPLMSLRQ